MAKAQASGLKKKPCKDCLVEDPTGKLAKGRLAKYPGPRCLTHHRARRKLAGAASHDKMVGRVYGLGPGEYHSLYLLQGGVCAICRRAKGISKRLAVDHDHRTGRVRGLLCGPCNQFIGYIGDNPEAGLRLAAYLGEGINYGT